MKRAATLLAAALAAMTLADAEAPMAREPLEADQAFRPEVRLIAEEPLATGRHGIDIEYRIAPGHYLYRDRMRFEVLPATLPIAPAERPEAEIIEDPFLGRSAIYRERVVIHLPFTASLVGPGSYRVRITAQGCAEDRICYAPFVQELPLAIPPGYRGRNPAAGSLSPGNSR